MRGLCAEGTSGLDSERGSEMKRLNDLLLNELANELKHRSWQCSECIGASECEEKYEPGTERYCWAMIQAAILEEEFSVPFPRNSAVEAK